MKMQQLFLKKVRKKGQEEEEVILWCWELEDKSPKPKETDGEAANLGPRWRRRDDEKKKDATETTWKMKVLDIL